VQDKDFPGLAFEPLGYQAAYCGEKSYNGVAIVSRLPVERVSCGFGDGDEREQSRILSASIGGVHLVNTYVPQGYAPDTDRFRYKLDWFQRLREFFARTFAPQDLIAWVGDFNVAPEPIDVYNPKRLLGSVGFHPDEHAALSYVKSWGFIDVVRKHQPQAGAYTFWDYRLPQSVQAGLGWRIDHIWATRSLAEKSVKAWIDTNPRCLNKPSDHTFVIAEFVL